MIEKPHIDCIVLGSNLLSAFPPSGLILVSIGLLALGFSLLWTITRIKGGT